VSLNGTSADPGVVHQEVQLLATELLQGVAQALDEGGEARTVTDIQLQHGGAYTGRLQRGGHGLGLVGLAVVSADDVDAAGGQVLAVLRLRLRLAPVIRAILRVMSVTSWAMAVTDRLLIGRWLLNPAKPEILFVFSGQMRWRMNKLELLRTFVRVSELSSFTSGRRQPGAAAFDRLRAGAGVEQLLGTRLFNAPRDGCRPPRMGCCCTSAARTCCRGWTRSSLFRADDAELAGCLRIDLPTMMARRVIVPALPEFLERFPRLEVEISCTDRQVDLLREGFDCVMRIGALSDLDVVARPVGHLSMRNCASPPTSNATACRAGSKTWRGTGWSTTCAALGRAARASSTCTAANCATRPWPGW
jgi:hypothetical protein